MKGTHDFRIILLWLYDALNRGFNSCYSRVRRGGGTVLLYIKERLYSMGYPRWTSLARFSTHDYQSSRSGTRTRLAYVLENTWKRAHRALRCLWNETRLSRFRSRILIVLRVENCFIEQIFHQRPIDFDSTWINRNQLPWRHDWITLFSICTLLFRRS